MQPSPAAVPSAAADQARLTLKQVFGFDRFRQGQEEVISRLLAGRSVLAIFPTGGGKSVCYQLPALMLDGLTLVISPLIALMKDQIDFLVGRGIAAARVDSSLPREELLQVYDHLNSGRLKLLYVSPERLGNERFLHTLQRRRIDLLAVDEAHCISEWGHNFRPDYLKIARLARQLRVGRVLALTATATPEVARDIAEGFGIAEGDTVHTGFYRPNLKIYVEPCRSSWEMAGEHHAERNEYGAGEHHAERDEYGKDRSARLLARLRSRPVGPTIVYVTLQRTSEEVASLLSGHGLDARAYHAGMEADERSAVQEAFMASDRMVVVATIAFGMGIDKADIRYIYHYNLPKTLENYSQEIGRAGRDGKPSVCELLACRDDVVTLENFTYGDTPTPEAVAQLVSDVLRRGDEFDVSESELATSCDVRPLVVKTLLTYLELEDVLQSTSPFYSQYKFQPQKSSQAILGQFDAERADFLRGVFRHAVKGRTWFSLDVDQASRTLGQPRQRIIAAIGYLEEKGDLVVEAAGVRQGYRLLKRPASLPALCDRLSRRFLRREEHDIARLRGVLEFAQGEGCLTRRLLAYFGESRGDCGHCGRCEGRPAASLPPPGYTPPGDEGQARIRRLLAERRDALAAPRQMTRFLCGISSPATTRGKLRTHAMFGAFESVPFHEVLALVEAAMRDEGARG